MVTKNLEKKNGNYRQRTVILTAEQAQFIEDWRRGQANIPGCADALRHFLDMGFKAAQASRKIGRP